MPHADALFSLVARYGDVAVAGLVLVGSPGVPLPVQLLLVLLGAASGAGRGTSFPLLAALGTAAACTGDLLVYLVGRTGGRPLLRRLLRCWGKGDDPERVARARLPLWRQSGLVILLTRFALTPLGTPVNLLSGATKMAVPRFLAFDLGGEAIFVLGSLALGRVAGPRVLTLGPLALVFWAAVVVLTIGPGVLIARAAPKGGGRTG